MEHKIKLIDAFINIIIKIKQFIVNNISLKYVAYESFERVWNLYQQDYSFNKKNLIIKYILTPYYLCIPSHVNNIDDFPFKDNNEKYFFDMNIFGFLSLRDLLNNKISTKFPLENGNFEHKIGDKINVENLNIHSPKFKILKVLLKTNKKNEFEQCTLFVNKNNIIFGIEEKSPETGECLIKIKYMHPLRELEICLDNSFINSLQLYFKTNNYIIECESNERRKAIKAELEQKRYEFRKWEFDSVIKLLDENEKNYRELGEDYKLDFYFGGKEGKEKIKDNKNEVENNKVVKKEE